MVELENLVLHLVRGVWRPHSVSAHLDAQDVLDLRRRQRLHPRALHTGVIQRLIPYPHRPRASEARRLPLHSGVNAHVEPQSRPRDIPDGSRGLLPA